MNYLDLFSGIGGFSLAMQRVGLEFEKHYASEIDKYARSIYARQFPESIQLGDITRIGDELGKVDLITGGFPCQTFSIAGERRGFEDTRGTLFFDIARLADIYKPRYMVLENVKGLLNHDGGNTIRVILDKLRGLDYHVQMLLLNTKDFNVPQNRERVFFICSAPGERRPEIFRIRERKTEIVKRTELRIAARDGKIKCGDTFASTLTCGGHGCGNHSDMDLLVGTLRTHKDGEGFREMQSGVCPTIPARAREDGSGQPVIMVKSTIIQTARGYNKGGTHDTCPTITKNSWEHNNHLIDGFNIRRLTPIECERLQDFPDDWTKYGDNNELVSDSQRYKTIGNSVTVRVVEAIAQIIKEAMIPIESNPF